MSKEAKLVKQFTEVEKLKWERLIKLSIRARGLSWIEVSARQDMEDFNTVRFSVKAMPMASFKCTKDYLLQYDTETKEKDK